MNPSHPLWRRNPNTQDRRRAPRYDTRLESRLFFPPPPDGEALSADDESQPLILTGYTRNVSETGLAIVVPSLRAGQQSLNRIGSELKIQLDLPTGEVHIEATPVYSLRLLAGDDGEGFLVGVRIRKMLDEEWVRLVHYVRRLAEEEEELP